MNLLQRITAVVVLSGVVIGCTSRKPVAPHIPPVAQKIPHESIVHGQARTDDYYWMREKESAKVIAHLNDENDYTDAMLAPTKPLQKELYNEFLSRIAEDDTEVPYQKGNWLYFSRTEKGKEYRIYCRKPASGGAEQVMLDLNAFAEAHEFVGLGAAEVSDDGSFLAYAIDFTGFRELHLFVKDLCTGETKLLSDENVTSIAWAADNKTLFYCVEDESKRPWRVLRTDITAASPKVVFSELDRQFNAAVSRLRSGRFVAIASASSDTSYALTIDAAKPDAPPAPVAPRIDGQEFYIDDGGQDSLVIRTNDKGRNFRLVSVLLASPDRAHWKELIAHRDDVMIEDHNCFAGFVVVSERTSGLPRLTIRETASARSRAIAMQEAIYNVSISHNELFDTMQVRYVYESPITPSSTYDFDLATSESILLKRDPAPNYDPGKYEVAQQFAVAADGVKIPISIVRKKGLVPGPHPLWLYAYGAYGFPETDDFNPARFSMLDRGVIFATAHIRGGGEMGKIWHEQGRLMNKRNTFTDFITCAEHLIEQKMTAPDQLAISGASAGGLTMGAVLNMRPDLFKAAIVGVPFVDVINTMLDDTLPLTTQEYLEWGNPNDKTAYEYMSSYSPYDNIQAQAYPSILVVTSLNDSQVMYWEPAKYAAKLRATKIDSNPLLLHCVMTGGHGGPSGRYDDYREEAMQYAFMLGQLGAER